MAVTTAVIPVAGLGTRFLPITKALPKEMLPVIDKPILQYTIEEALNAGIERIILVTSRGKSIAEDYFDLSPELEQSLDDRNSQMLEEIQRISRMANIITVRQRQPLGLGHAIWCARKHIDGPFAVMLPDDIVFSKTPCIKQLISVYNKYKTSVIAVEEVPKEQVNKYGIIEISDSYSEDTLLVKAIVEKPKIEDSPSSLAAIGRYILMPNIMDELATKDVGEGGEIQLTDAIGKTINTSKCCAYRFEGERFDCGSVLGSLEAQIFAALKEDLYKKDTIKILNRFLKKDQ